MGDMGHGLSHQESVMGHLCRVHIVKKLVIAAGCDRFPMLVHGWCVPLRGSVFVCVR
jgi:hypothetical protein